MNECLITRMAEEIGTPFYVFDSKVLGERIAYLRANLPKEMELCYAMKANSFIIGELADQIDRFEVCSPGEYDICVSTGIPMEKVVISGVYKNIEDTRRMAEASPKIGWYTVESLQQLADLDRVSREKGMNLRVLLRLTSGNQFGLNEGEIRDIIADRDRYPLLDFAGLQFFSGTQKKIRRITKELTRLNAFLDELEQDFGYIPRELEYGAGLPVNYFRETAVETEEQIAENTAREYKEETELLIAVAEQLQPLAGRAHLTMELGRSIAASCGTYVTKVVDTKQNGGENYAILDGGIHHIAYYGQMMAMKVPYFTQIPCRQGEKTEEWNLCGALCTINDLILKQLPTAKLMVGDLFAFERAGAYCPTEGISLFLSRALPAVVILGEDGSSRVVREHTDTFPLNTALQK